MAKTFGISDSTSSSGANSPTHDSNTSNPNAAAIALNHATRGPISFNSAAFPLKLTPTNYPSWKMQFTCLIAGYDLLGFLDGTNPCPVATEPTYALWARQDQLLRHALITSVSENITPYIAAAPTAQHAWETLANLYANRSRARVLTLKERLHNMRREGRSVSEYLRTLKAVADELGTIDRPLSDDDLTIYILNGLGPEFREIAASLRTRDTSLSFDDLHDRLVAHEESLRWEDTKLASTPFTAHFARAATTPSSFVGTFAGLLPTPHNGHFAHNCPFYRVQQHPPHANFASSPNIASEDWLLDSGATHHVTTDLANLALHSEYLGPDELQIGDGTGLKITHPVPIDIACHRPAVDRSLLPLCAAVPHHAVPHSPASLLALTSTPRSPTQRPCPTSTHTVTPTIAELDSSPPLSSTHATSDAIPLPPPPPPMRTHPMVPRSQNHICKPKSLHHATMASPLPSPEPTCVSQALKDFHWRWAMSEEFNALIRQGTWELVPSHPNQHVLGCKGSVVVFFLVYVDDIIVTGNNLSFITSLIRTMGHRFSLKEPSDLSYFLGIEAVSVNGCLLLSQHRYIQDLLQKSGMTEAKPVATPLASTSNLLLNTGVPLPDGLEYRKLVGSLQYLAFTRPDISFAVSRLSQFMHKPTDVHWQALKRVLRYLRGTTSHGILLRPQQSLSIHAFSDADWAGDRDTCLSTTGYIVFLGGNPILWRAAKQRAVARSSTEAEYRALAASSSELVWVTHLLNELGIPITDPPALYCDNVSATYLSSNPVLHSRMKHIAVDLHFVRDLVDKKVLRVSHIASTDQLADGFTKPLHSTRFTCLRDKIRVADGTSILRGRVKETKSAL
ncbi:hypothetical protein SLEP1_g3180 [Rubroshorea leprosula]|uniref:Reverse transcriptase Ty1/copia-type domain-containing protein n=2 Tax=Rubroshorea leprosula TaxID=152421 RepID=A0AAV5HVD1_9ROSI|nr:hypothetical protein SLEP1_g3180 [Rubroshorea leprosula]